LVSTQALRLRYIKALTKDHKRLTTELESVSNQLAVLKGKPNKIATVAFADMAHHRVDARKGRKLSRAHRLAIKRGIAASKKAKANGK
jgi:hypothetical protein